MQKSTWANLLLGGLVVGTFDITYAITFWKLMRDVAPIRILQSVAAGLLGREAARAGGVQTALLGTFLHYFIATTIVIVYWIACRYLPLLARHPILCGAVYGIGVYLVMNYVVVPLSAARSTTKPMAIWVVCSVIVHMFLIGVPAAWFASRAVTTVSAGNSAA